MTDDQWRRAQPVLTQAIGLDAAVRDRLLESAFGDDLAFRGELLKVLEECRAATVGFQTTGETLAGASEEPILTAGDMCGRYRVVRLLGVGGMGQVYLAEDIDLGTPVALKLVSNPLLESADARARLRREAARAAQLRYHPHIATVLQFMEVEANGRNVAVLAMEYVSGASAGELLGEGPIAVDRAIRWAIQIARAMEFAHEKGILHCDLKPANVQIEETASGEHVKVVDFGVARARVDHSRSEAVAGTPAYMAPEQLAGHHCATASDIYSLGVTLFELVTARLPYHATEFAEFVIQVLAAPVPKASTHQPAVPKALDAVLQRAMAKSADARYSSMAAFRRDLELLLRAPQPIRWGLVAAGVGGGLAFVTLLGFVASQALDQGLGRATEFEVSSVVSWFYWGVRSLIAPAVFSLTLLLAFVCAASAVRLIGSVRSVRAWFAPIVMPLGSSLARFSSLPTSTLGQLLLLLHVVILGALALYFRPLLAGFMNFMMAARGSIQALSPSNLQVHELYGYLVTTELLVFCLAWYRLLRLRNRRREHDDPAYLVAGAAAIGLSVFLFTARFRILSHSESERVVYELETCYLVEDRGASALLFCPRTFPRNVVVRTADLVRTGKIESIFAALDPS